MLDRRTHFREGLHPLYAPLYDALGVALGDDWQPVCGLRSFETQADLFSHGRTAPGPTITQAGPGLSFHQYGLASDWDYFPGGRYTPLAYDDKQWQVYLMTCLKLGLRVLSWEKPHNELDIHVPIREILAAFNQGGMSEVTQLLTKGMNHD